MWRFLLNIWLISFNLCYANDFNESQQMQIRHGRSRARSLRANRHFDSDLDDVNTKYDFTSLLVNKDDPISAVATNPAITLKAQLRNSLLSISEKKINVFRDSDLNRRITVDGNFTTNHTWLNLDKGEPLLNVGKKKNVIEFDFENQNNISTVSRDPMHDSKSHASSEMDRDFAESDHEFEDPFVPSEISKSDARNGNGHVDIVTRFLRIVESQHLLGENCTAGTDLNLGEGVVDRYAQERFRVEADVAVNRANMLTRLWKYVDPNAVLSEYLLHASVFSMVEFDDDIFAAGNCYDQYQYKDYWLFCPYAYRLPEGGILVKDLAIEYKYLSNTSEWFYIARKNAENVIKNYKQFSRGYNTYTFNESTHTERVPDEILSVRYEDGKWSKPYYDCGGGNIWMLTYTVPFFGFNNNTYFFKGTSGIDVDLRRVDIDQCPLPADSTQLNIFAASDKCKKRTTECVPLSGLGFRRGSYKCVCRRGYYFPDTKAERRYYNGTVIEEEYEKLMLGDRNHYGTGGIFECLQCPEGCDHCEDDRPCVVSLNWVMRAALLVLSCVIICSLPIVVVFTWKYGNIKVVRAASPVLLRVIILGAFFIYTTTIVMYPKPSVYTCTARVWLREIGFSLTYGALMLKTWRISVIFRVRSAKAVKITDMNLLKRLGVIVAIFTVFLVIRTLVAPPVVIVGRTADDLKAYLCRTDWWDHSFSILEVLFLVWGIRLCIVVRKAPSEFNESRFISMAIYNEFLLSVFLNVSMLFLQKPANPDLLYIIFFCHTQLTVTLLLGLIFGSKAYMVFKGHDKPEEGSGMLSKTQTSKFLGKGRSENSQYTSTNSSATGLEYSKITEYDVQEEFVRLYTQLEMLKEKNMRVGNRHLAGKITAMQDAASRHDHDQNMAATSINYKLNNMISMVTDKLVSSSIVNPEEIEITGTIGSGTPPIIGTGSGHEKKGKRQSVSFAQTTLNGGDVPSPVTAVVTTKETMMYVQDFGESASSSAVAGAASATDGSSIELLTTGRDQSAEAASAIAASASPATNRNGRLLKSGHARTHAIVINLDDKSRFTEEVTV